MPRRSTLLKELLSERHWQAYVTFCQQYDDAAAAVDPMLVGRWPSRGQFARWLTGDIKSLPHPDHCRVLETMFDGVSARELFTFSGCSFAERSRPDYHLPEYSLPIHSLPDGHGRSVLSRLDPDRLDVEAAPLSSIPAARRPSAPITPSTGLTDPVTETRSGPIHEAGTPNIPERVNLARFEETAMTSEESARFVRGTRGGVDHDVLDQLGADVRQLATDYLSRPPLMMFRPLSQRRAEVFDLLDKRQNPALLPPLYSVAGRLCGLLAHANADLGHTDPAENHTRTAWLCADLADDDSLRAYVRWVQSNLAYWNGDYRRAAQIAHSGQRFASKGSNLLRLASQEARAWAACGESSEVEQALSVAATAREHHTGDDQVGVFGFEPGKAAYYASEVRLALGGEANARLALDDADTALELLSQMPAAQRSPEFVAAARLDRANAHLALSDLDATADQLRIVLQLPVECRTQPIVGRARSAADTLRSSRFTHSALALELREEIGLFRAYPARRDVTEALD